jgi:hypothetical protein
MRAAVTEDKQLQLCTTRFANTKVASPILLVGTGRFATSSGSIHARSSRVLKAMAKGIAYCCGGIRAEAIVESASDASVAGKKRHRSDGGPDRHVISFS